MKVQRILLAGGTGAVGREVLRKLHAQGHFVRTLSRSPRNAEAVRGLSDEVVLADAARRESLRDATAGMDAIVSCLGAPVSLSLRERRGFLAVDLPAHENLLDAARQAGVARFVYLSAHPGPGYAHTRYMRAHLDVEERIRAAGLAHSFVRPTGIFSALDDLLQMARRGTGSVVGDGRARTNPIHPEDVAAALCEALEGGPEELSVGGPEVLTREEIMRVAFEAVGKEPRYMHVPAGLFRGMGKVLSLAHPRLSDLMEFFAAVTTSDSVAPAYGKRTLRDWFTERARGG
jgi:uncharacterized protein YbjT (DUF2867 family)